MFLKINQKTNRWMTIATVIYLILLLISLTDKVGHVIFPLPIYYILYGLMTLLYVLLLVYLINTLIFFNEKTFIVVAFSMFLCLFIIDVAVSVYSISYMLAATIGTLFSIINIYVFISTLVVKNKYIAFSYILFGFGLLVSTVTIFF